MITLFWAHACLDGWSATGAVRYYRSALELAERMNDTSLIPTGGLLMPRRRVPEMLRVDGMVEAVAGFADTGRVSGGRGGAAAPRGAQRPG